MLDRSLRWSQRDSALEQGWLLAELEQRSATAWRSWRAVLIEAYVGWQAVWRWWNCSRKACSSKSAVVRFQPQRSVTRSSAFCRGEV
ncbi:MAG: hypothetical protein DMG56_27945 [Acidobacteria bacterium]|nr:MAG: hypothetical protein DMG56_27945 [Acidobacteriota bacterium]